MFNLTNYKTLAFKKNTDLHLGPEFGDKITKVNSGHRVGRDKFPILFILFNLAPATPLLMHTDEINKQVYCHLKDHTLFLAQGYVYLTTFFFRK